MKSMTFFYIDVLSGQIQFWAYVADSARISVCVEVTVMTKVDYSYFSP